MLSISREGEIYHVAMEIHKQVFEHTGTKSETIAYFSTILDATRLIRLVCDLEAVC